MTLPLFAAATLALVATSSAVACIQGHDLPRVAPTFAVPLSLQAPKPEELKFTAPNLAPPNLELSLKPARPSPTFVSADEALTSYAKIVSTYEAQDPELATAEQTTDYAASLIFLGRASEAIAVLTALESKYSGLYTTAANLGTAYELTGNLEEALAWIREGVARNPDSHAGTEWLHVAILQTKLALQRDASWLAEHSVLHAAGSHSTKEILRAIEYQLNERLRFVNPPDPVVCDLFYQAAVRVETTRSPERRASYLDQSLRFGDLRKQQIAKAGADS